MASFAMAECPEACLTRSSQIPPVTLLLGGARSGKSRMAERLATDSGLARRYVATAEALDDEMRRRVDEHRRQRGEGWSTSEVPIELAKRLPEIAIVGAVALVDCLTLWLSNLMHVGRDPERETAALCAAIDRCEGPLVFVSNEVGLGIVPENALARRFRDAHGRMNQAVAARADRVLFLAAGLPLELKRWAVSDRQGKAEPA